MNQQIPKSLVSIWQHPTKNDLLIQDEMNQMNLTRDTNLLSQILGVQLELVKTYPDLIKQYTKEYRTTNNFEITLKGSPEPWYLVKRLTYNLESPWTLTKSQLVMVNWMMNKQEQQTFKIVEQSKHYLQAIQEEQIFRDVESVMGSKAFTITKNVQTLFVENVEDRITTVNTTNSSNTVQKEYYGITTETKPVDAIKKKYGKNSIVVTATNYAVNHDQMYQQISDDNASDKEIIREQLIDSGSLITCTSCGTEKLKQQMENWGGSFFCKIEERLVHTIALELINPNYTFEGRLRHWTESTRKRTSYNEVNLTLTREIFEEIQLGRINPQTVNREIQLNDVFSTPNGIMLQQFINEEITDETDEQLFGQLILMKLNSKGQ
ncbi:7933_t:CDS:2 [Ambispora leptoticha]|uniref:7933_t:CDS:1 n=1 Tax=Ambispora leptoticha TaxID=144679 RepID=A0A9N9I944_9GLOM|nr:7933_t:CDS:2 [Ambispora leptoticha]